MPEFLRINLAENHYELVENRVIASGKAEDLIATLSQSKKNDIKNIPRGTIRFVELENESHWLIYREASMNQVSFTVAYGGQYHTFNKIEVMMPPRFYYFRTYRGEMGKLRLVFTTATNYTQAIDNPKVFSCWYPNTYSEFGSVCVGGSISEVLEGGGSPLTVINECLELMECSTYNKDLNSYMYDFPGRNFEDVSTADFANPLYASSAAWTHCRTSDDLEQRHARFLIRQNEVCTALVREHGVRGALNKMNESVQGVTSIKTGANLGEFFSL